MKCLVCNKELPEGVGSCPVCGFPLLYVTSTDGMDDPEIIRRKSLEASLSV